MLSSDVIHWIVVGAGYTGKRLVERLIEAGEDVVATGRTTPSIAGATCLAFDALQPAPLPVDDAILVWLAPPPGEVVRGAKRTVYISSTGVYAPGGGARVDETWPTEPTTESGTARLAAERALPADACILRVAGIYGPGRGIEDRLRAGTYRIVGDGGSHVSRIHVDDLVTAIIAAGRSDARGPINIADDDPAPIGPLADAIAARLGVPAPPRVAPAAVSPEVAGMLLADRRIANDRMKRELGVTLRYPRVAV
jgi:nucleoside-diphosphate-sugar epimerase